jgi:beta-galactosidase/beta-glucuronidase
VSDDPDLVHPRPQLVRDSWVDLGGSWQFAYDDGDQGASEEWHCRSEPFESMIVVPFPPESQLSGIGDTGYHPVLWYRRRVDPPSLPEGSRLLLHFGAVDYRASVWANGSLVGEHEGGQTPFTCDVTAALTAGDPDDPDDSASGLTVVVRAEDQPLDVGQPRGKQDWEEAPHGVWYHRTSGIWQPVWLEVVPATHVTELHWTSDVAGARVRSEVRLNRTPVRPLSLRLVLATQDGEVLADHTAAMIGRVAHLDIAVPALRHQRHRQRLLWRPGSPTLVDVTVTVLDGATVVDEVRSYLGLRSVGVDGGHLVVNGRSVYLRGVLAQGYWPQSHLAAPDGSALRREVELILALGFNAVRLHQKVEDPRFLYWCDRLGLLVWGEMANAFTYDSEVAGRVTREWLEVLRRDRSHPCIVTWVPHNESWGVEDVATEPAQRSFVTALYHLTKAVDPTRPVISNDGWEHTESDLLTLHDYAARGARLTRRYGTPADVREFLRSGRILGRKVLLGPTRHQGQPVMLTEFGGVRFDPSGTDHGWGYSEVRSPESFVQRVRELVGAVVDSTSITGFSYTQLTDTEQEQNGLLTADREPKAPVAALRRAVTQPRGRPDTGADSGSRLAPLRRRVRRVALRARALRHRA